MNPCTPVDVTRDLLLDGRVVVWQPRAGYRAGIDPVLLAASVRAGPEARVLDLGCGVGVVSLCLLARRPDLEVSGVDADPLAIDLARRNAGENGFADRFTAMVGDITTPSGNGFEVVVTNPPYGDMSRGTAPAGGVTARTETTAGLDDWIAAAIRALRPRGTLALIHRADRVDHVLASLRRSCGDIRLCPLWPRAGVPARRVLVSARKGTRGPALLSPGLVLHEADGRFTGEADRVLRGAALAG
ncbi:MAG: methyltransferase [Alphaproteobacteria bacterium]|nr:methyltransferase [Alphaproteobacteria bacterium]